MYGAHAPAGRTCGCEEHERERERGLERELEVGPWLPHQTRQSERACGVSARIP
jgi:hypothetical protein